MACRAFKIWTSDQAKIGIFDVLEVDRGVVDQLFLSLYGSDMVLLLYRASQEAVLQRSGMFRWLTACCGL